MKTSNCVEEKEWVDLLSKICQSNAARLESFHPSAYIGGAWTWYDLMKNIDLLYVSYSYFSFFQFFSCKERNQFVTGCQTVSPSPFQMGLATTLDPARDLQRLNTLILNNLDSLKLFTETNTGTNVQLHKNVMAMIDTALKLQQIHLTYRALVDREMKYGSRQAPIGDDNYLLMRSGLGACSNQTLPSVNHQKQQALGLDGSPNFFIRNELLRSSLTNDKISHY